MTFTHFAGKYEDSAVRLDWATASEQNNDYFEVQRSRDGSNFEVLDKVAGAGTHSGMLFYDFTDRNPRAGVNYYRLRQVDFDGSFEYSNIVSVQVDRGERSMSVFPNPASSYVLVELPVSWSSGPVDIFVRDHSGRILRQMQVSGGDGPLQVSTAGLPAGFYTLQASNGAELLAERVMLTGQ